MHFGGNSRLPARLIRSVSFALGTSLLVAGCQTSSLDASMGMESGQTRTGGIAGDDLSVGKAHFRDGNYGLAEAHFRKAVELQPDDAEAWLGLAATYDQLGRFDLADRAYEELLGLAGRRPRIINNIGYSHLLRGDRKRARELLMEANAALPGDPVVQANLALLNKS